MDELTPGADPLLKDLQWLRALARSLVRDPHLAEDAVQETLVKAMTHRPRSRTSLRAWLASVLRNEVRQEQRGRVRRLERESRLERSGTTPATAEIVEELALHRRLVELVQELEEPQRTAVVLRFLRGRTPRQIARELDVPVKTVHSRLERGLARLRGRLDREFGDERGAWVSVLAPLLDLDRGGLGLALGSLVMPMNVKLIAAGAGVVALAALAYLPFASRPGPVDRPPGPERVQAVHPPRADEDAQSLVADVDPQRPERVTAREAPAAPAAPESSGPPSIEGFVREMDGRPVGGVRVVFEARRGETFQRPPSAPTASSNPDGSFRLLLPPEPGRLTVESQIYASVSRPFLEGRVPGEPPIVVVAPRRVYAGRVIDVTGEPVPNARVEVTLDGSWIQSHSVGESPLHLLLPFAEQRTDASGQFRFEGLGFVEGAHVEALRDGFQAARADLPPESELELELVLEGEDVGEPAVYGRVLDANGVGVSDAHVSLGWTSVRSGPEGRFTLVLDWVESGTLRAVKPGHRPAAVPFDRATGDGTDPARPLVLYLGDRPLKLRGRVVDARGEPAAGVSVFTPDTTHFGRVLIETAEDSTLGQVTVEELLTGTAGPSHGWRRLETETDGAGRFELDGLLARDYALFAMRADLAAAGPVLGTPGAGEVELVLEEAERRPVKGRVLSRGGLPLAGVQVVPGRSLEWQTSPERQADSWENSPVRPPGASWLFDEGPVVTDAEGRFELAGIAVVDGAFLNLRGPAILLAHNHRFGSGDDLEDLELVAEARCDFRVVLTDAGEADAVSLLDEDGKLYPLFVRVEDKTISMPRVEIRDGRTGVIQIGEGRRTLVLEREGGEVRRCEVTFSPGDVQEIRL